MPRGVPTTRSTGVSKKGVRKGAQTPKAKAAKAAASPASSEADEEVEATKVKPKDVGITLSLGGFTSVAEAEAAIATGKAELARLRAVAKQEAIVKDAMEKIAALSSGGIAAPSAKEVKSAVKTGKKRKTCAEVKSSSSEDESDSSDDGSQLSLGSEVESSESDVEPKKKKRRSSGSSNASGVPLTAKATLYHWRRQAKTLSTDGKVEMRGLLRVLKMQKRTINQVDLKAFAFELLLMYVKHTDGPVVAERYRINEASGHGQDGAIDMKKLRTAQKQSAPILQVQLSKNEPGSQKTQRARKRGNGGLNGGLGQKPPPQWNQWKLEQQGKQPPPRPSVGEVRCFKCDKQGHRAFQCPTRAKGEKDGNKSS